MSGKVLSCTNWNYLQCAGVTGRNIFISLQLGTNRTAAKTPSSYKFWLHGKYTCAAVCVEAVLEKPSGTGRWYWQLDKWRETGTWQDEDVPSTTCTYTVYFTSSSKVPSVRLWDSEKWLLDPQSLDLAGYGRNLTWFLPGSKNTLIIRIKLTQTFFAH